MSDYCNDNNYKIEIERKIEQLSGLEEYMITGQKLVKRIQYRLKLFGSEIKDKDLNKSAEIDLKRVTSRYEPRKPRANYGKLSTELVDL